MTGSEVAKFSGAANAALAELVALRTEASKIHAGLVGGPSSSGTKSFYRQRKESRRLKGLNAERGSSLVTLDLPSVSCGTLEATATQAMIPFCLSGTAPLLIPLDKTVLFWLFVKAQAPQPSEPKRKAPNNAPAKWVHYDKVKGGFVSKKAAPDSTDKKKSKSKVFKASDTDGCNEIVINDAVAWQAE